ncbi:MAG: nicotinate (nicotinamide) nucleotide adenylyltransferase [Rubrivivax sp.]|nr:nicotinate (nicotinamide) nucleotide adenylyltransferase [Rubrivivax sp.]
MRIFFARGIGRTRVPDLSPQQPGGARPRRIGLFGGSFDPPHRAHLALARAAFASLGLDELRWLPAGQPWQKPRALSAAAHREAMVRATIEGEPGFVLERCELERQGPSYTIDTVEQLALREPTAQWLLIIGQDQLARLHTWHRWQALLQRVQLAVAARAGAPATGEAAVLQSPWQTVPLPPMEISSTDIRQRVLRGEPIADLVPPAVARYIARHHLYRKDAAPAI